jgi:subtilisin family serine protease
MRFSGRTIVTNILLAICAMVMVFTPGFSRAGGVATTFSSVASLLIADFQQATIDKQKTYKSTVSQFAQAPSNRLIIKFKSTATVAARVQAISSYNLTSIKDYRMLNQMSLVEAPAGVSVKDLRNSLLLNPDIEYVEIDRPVYLRVIPDDLRFNQLWSLDNISDSDINAVEAWDVVTGDPNVVLAVIDTGIDYTHEDLRDNVWKNPNEIPGNGIDDDRNGYIDDEYGIDPGEGDTDPLDPLFHGTHVAGIIAARGNNALGITGVNWNSKVLACKIFSFSAETMEGFVSKAIECLDYILDLKVNHGINIVASNNSWGWSGDESRALKEAIQRNSDAGILFVAAAGNRSASNDELDDFPSSYYLPNVISVASSDSFDSLSYFSSYGEKTVHITAPGSDILSSFPGYAQFTAVEENPFTDIFQDYVENGEGLWSAQAPWAISTNNSRSPVSSWTDSPVGNYADNINSSLTSPVIDLSANVANRIQLGFYAYFSIEEGFDNVFIELSGDGGATWIKAGELTGAAFGWNFYHYLIPDVVKTANFQFRFRLSSDDFINMDGIHIDNIGVGIDLTANPEGSNNYQSLSGTSMASPHVVGVIGLLKAQNPALSMMQLKNLIIAGGTPIPSLADNTISGRRLRAFDVNGTGSLSCADQTVLRRLRPTKDVVFVSKSGQDAIIDIAYLNINCDAPDSGQTTNGGLPVTIQETGETIMLLDNGAGFDQLANDGVFSGQYNVGNFNGDSLTVLLPDATTLFIRLVDQYSFTENISYQWREIAGVGTALEMNDDSGAVVQSPFPIMYGDNSVGYEQLYVSDNGLISLYERYESIHLDFVPFFNDKLPTTLAARIVSPYWFDLLPTGGNIYWAVLGEAPNRELVIQWDDVRLYGSSLENYLTFQVVFFENRSGIVFSYQDVDLGIPVVDNGGLATVGVQIHSSLGKNFSYRTPKLANNKSILAVLPGSSTEGYNRAGAGMANGGGGSGGGGFSVWLIAAMLLSLFASRLSRS